MGKKRSAKKKSHYNLMLHFTEAGDRPDYLYMIESITREAEECGLLFETISDQESPLMSLSDFLTLTHSQSAIFAVMAELSLQSEVTIDMLAGFFKCKVMRVLSILDQIDVLEACSLVKRNTSASKRMETYRDISFSVSKNVMEALRQGDRRLLQNINKMSFTALLDYMKQLLTEREEGTLNAVQLIRETEELLALNRKLPFIQYLNSCLNHASSKVVALCLIMNYLNGNMEATPQYFSGILFERFTDQIDFTRNVYEGRHELVAKGVAKLSAGGRHDDRILTLSTEPLRLLFTIFPSQAEQGNTREGLISYWQIKEKTLFFDHEVAERTRILEKMLDAKQYQVFLQEA